jgi:hypothetical protein
MEGYAENFTFFYDLKKDKEMKGDDLKRQCIILDTLLSYGDAQDVNRTDLSSEHVSLG